jgi:hypothetical protein
MNADAATSSVVAPVPTGWIELPQLGLIIESPASGATVTDFSADRPGSRLIAGDILIDVIEVGSWAPKTLAEAKAAIQSDPDPRTVPEPEERFRRFSKAETIDAGWHIEFEFAIRDTPLYGVEVRKTIHDKQYRCSNGDHVSRDIATIASACLSLKRR